jgi:hypothetical protein
MAMVDGAWLGSAGARASNLEMDLVTTHMLGLTSYVDSIHVLTLVKYIKRSLHGLNCRTVIFYFMLVSVTLIEYI